MQFSEVWVQIRRKPETLKWPVIIIACPISIFSERFIIKTEEKNSLRNNLEQKFL